MSKRSLVCLPSLLVAVALAAALIAGCENDVPTSAGDADWQPLFTSNSLINPCTDGQVKHGVWNCSSCSGKDFTATTSGKTAEVSRDMSQSGMCGESQAVMYFSTYPLHAECSVQSATLSFYVSNLTSLDVDEVRVRVFSKTNPASCQSSLNAGDFIGCGGGYTDLGTAAITGTGWVTFNIPNPNTNIATFQTGHRATKFVIVDDSDYSSEFGSQVTMIATMEAVNKPRLEVVTYDCFETCLDGTLFHNEATDCNNCAPGEFSAITNFATAWAYHREPDPQCAYFMSGAFIFDTSGLDGYSPISTATLYFNVSEYSQYLNAPDPQVRIYGVAHEMCPSGLGSGDSPSCNSALVPLGVVPITAPGAYSFTIPDPNEHVKPEGYTEFVFGDASLIQYPAGGEGEALTGISTSEETVVRLRPRLEIRF